MKFKKNTMMLVLATALSVTSFTSLASNSVTINFTGEIADSPCTISGSGGAVNPLVDLGSVKKSDIASMNEQTDKVRFSLKLSNCTGSQTIEVQHQANDNGTGKIQMISENGGYSKNVALQLFKQGEASPLISGTNVDMGSVTSPNTILDFEANMIALTNTAPAEKVTANVPLLISYN